MSCGIYKIVSELFKERIYIGSASDIQKRWNRHRYDLIHNKHHSVKLQRHFNKYGIDDLTFTIIMECERIDLLKHEQNYLDSYLPYFNNSPTASSNLGSKLSDETRARMSKNRIGIKRSDETRLKISKGLTGRIIGETTREKMRQNNLGKILSEETKNKMSLTRQGRKFKKII